MSDYEMIMIFLAILTLLYMAEKKKRQIKANRRSVSP